MNRIYGKGTVSGVCLGVSEGQLIKKLRDKKGVWLCANYPAFKVNGKEDASVDTYGILLYLVEKVPSGSQSDEEEIQHYARMQRLMVDLIEELIGPAWNCLDLVPVDGLNVEWEYDVFGGWNGMSVSLKAEEYYV